MNFSKAFRETLHEQIEYFQSHFHENLVMIAKGLFLALPIELAISMVFWPFIPSFPHDILVTIFGGIVILCLISIALPWIFFWQEVFRRMKD